MTTQDIDRARRAGKDDYEGERRMHPPTRVVESGLVDEYLSGYRQAYSDAVKAAKASIATRSMVERLSVGDTIPNCFGRLRRVTEIYGRGVSNKGRAFVRFYQEFGPSSTMSGSLVEGDPVSMLLATSEPHEDHV